MHIERRRKISWLASSNAGAGHGIMLCLATEKLELRGGCELKAKQQKKENLSSLLSGQVTLLENRGTAFETGL